MRSPHNIDYVVADFFYMDDIKMHFKSYSKFFFSRLPEEEKSAYKRILNAWLNFKDRVSVKNPHQKINFQRVYQALVDDNPELFYVVRNSLSFRSGFGMTIVTVRFSMSENEANAIKEQIYQIIQKVKANISGRDALRAIHDYLALNVQYASNLYSENAHNICGPFLEKSAVCEGYSRAFKLMCDEVSIPCIIVSGVAIDDNRTDNHAWNIVRKEKNNYHVDVTWNSGIYKSVKMPLYYSVSDAFMEKDHRWNRSIFPPCSTPGSYEKEVFDIGSRKTLCDVIERMALQKKVPFVLNFNKQMGTVENLMELINEARAERNISNVSSTSVVYLPNSNYVVVSFSYT